MSRRKLLTVALLAGVASGAGCGGGAGGRVAVEGTITLDGAPLEGVQVLFDQPELSPNENIGYRGKTDAEGRYALRPLGEDRAGVPPGNYRVSLTTAETVDPSRDDSPMTPERIPPAYRGGRLTAEVPPEGDRNLNFELRSR